MVNNDDISHEGHRKRLLDLAVNAGIDNMSDVQVVEYMLTYIFPRGDVNPLAHRLLDTYGNLTAIIDASYFDLMNVKGLNERSAEKISMLGELFFGYTTAKLRKKWHVSNLAEILDVVEDSLRFRTTENLLLLGLSPANYICGRKRLNLFKVDEVSIPVMELTAFISSVKPTSLVVAHCHPYGEAFPSKSDKSAFKMVKNICYNCGVNLIESLIVGENGVYGQVKDSMLRTYHDIDAVKENLLNTMQISKGKLVDTNKPSKK